MFVMPPDSPRMGSEHRWCRETMGCWLGFLGGRGTTCRRRHHLVTSNEGGGGTPTWMSSVAQTALAVPGLFICSGPKLPMCLPTERARHGGFEYGPDDVAAVGCG